MPDEPMPNWTEPKQKQGEWWARREPPIVIGRRYHLHYLFVKGKWQWVLRLGRKSICCGTPRCRIVTLMPAENN